jgi:putative flavoprotein involved in K+ transport
MAQPVRDTVDRQNSGRERLDVVVIGGGQAGLSVGYHLSRTGLSFAILDAEERVGDAWRRRWDSLRLFTPAWLDGLDGMPFPAQRHHFPTKDEMGDYLEAYAKRFELPVRSGVRVESVSREGQRYLVRTERCEFEADHVVVAMSNFQRSKVPSFAKDIRGEIVQLHSSDYRSPSDLRPGGVLVVGGGNSGAEIAMELATCGHKVWLSGRDTGHLPFRVEGLAGRMILVRLVMRVMLYHVLTVRTPPGRRARKKILAMGALLIRVKPQDLLAAGVERTSRAAGVRDGLPVLEDGRVLPVENVVWCTGFENGSSSSFVNLPVFDEGGEPHHEEGIVRDEPGLYFVGRQFLYAMASSMVQGVGRDAARVVTVVVGRCRRRSEPGEGVE